MVAVCDFGCCQVLDCVYDKMEENLKIDENTARQLQSRLEKVKSLGGAFAAIELSEHVSALF